MIDRLTSRGPGPKARTRSRSKARPTAEVLEGRALLATTVAETPLPSDAVAVGQPVAGSDGDVWFAEAPAPPDVRVADRVARVAPDGTTTEFPLPKGVTVDGPLTLGPDGNLWFASGHSVGVVATDGTVSTFPLPEAGAVAGHGLTSGSDGNVWLTVSYPVPGHAPTFLRDIVKVAPDGTATAYHLPAGTTSVSAPVEDWDGNFWLGGSDFTKVTPDGAVTTYALPKPDRAAYNLTVGNDGNLWYSEVTIDQSKVIGDVTTDGTVTEYPVGSAPIQAGAVLTVGNDGNLWAPGNGSVIRINTDGTITPVPLPGGAVVATGAMPLVYGPDGGLWFVEHATAADGTTPVDRIAGVSIDGVVTALDLPAGASPGELTQGGDGNLWYVDAATHAVGHVAFDPPVPVVGPGPILYPILLQAGTAVPVAVPAPPTPPALPRATTPTPVPVTITAEAMGPRGASYARRHLTLTFSAGLDLSAASIPSHYTVMLVGPRGRYRPHEKPLTVKAASYDPTTHRVTLTTRQRLNPSASYRLTVRGVTPSGVVSAVVHKIKSASVSKAASRHRSH